MSCMYLESALARLLSTNTGIMVTYFLFPDLSLWVTGRGFAYNCLWGVAILRPEVCRIQDILIQIYGQRQARSWGAVKQ
jgi:hypothetical protein